MKLRNLSARNDKCEKNSIYINLSSCTVEIKIWFKSIPTVDYV
jgi:hypothetical protein